jgi:hypothetical protein
MAGTHLHQHQQYVVEVVPLSLVLSCRVASRRVV